MKRSVSLILCVILCVSLALSLASCNRKTLETFNDSTPEELYSVALQSVADMSNYEIVHEQTVTTSAFIIFKHSIGQTITIHMDGDDFYQNIECDEEGVWDADDVLECWYVDDYFYAETSGAMRKQYVDPAEMEGGIYDFDNADGMLLNLPQSWFKNSKFYSEKGEIYLEFIIDGKEYYDLMLESGGDTGYAGYAEEDVCYRVYFHEDGTVDRIHSTFKCVITEDGIDVKVAIDTVSTVKNIGGTTITLPEGASGAQAGNWFYFN